MDFIIKYLDNLKENNKKTFEILDDLIEKYGCNITKDIVEKDIRTIYLNKNDNNFIIKTKIIIDNNNIKKEIFEIKIYSYYFNFILDY